MFAFLLSEFDMIIKMIHHNRFLSGAAIPADKSPTH